MPDSRNIIRDPGGGAWKLATDGTPVITVPAAECRTGQVIVDGTPNQPSPVLAASPRRRSAVVYYPATDPVLGTPNTDPVWLTGEPGDVAFPLEPGATLSCAHVGWLHGYTADLAVLYIYEERD